MSRLSLVPLDVDRDAVLLHTWVTHPKAPFWMMTDADVEAVRSEYARIAAHPHHDAFLGLVDGRPAFLAERYDPRHVELAGLYDHQPGDVGMHFLTGPADPPVAGFTRDVLTCVMTWLFTDPAVHRVVVEPDVRNTKVQALNAVVGFEVVGRLTKPEKEALLSTCTREQFLATTGARSC
jgi:RimJ/RimL family protein N-acetyltransferase